MLEVLRLQRLCAKVTEKESHEIIVQTSFCVPKTQPSWDITRYSETQIYTPRNESELKQPNILN